MKKTLLSTALALGVGVGGNALAANGIQIDPTGSGSIGSSIFLTSLGSSFGNILLENAFNSTGINTTIGATTVWAHNGADELGGELTWTFTFSATATAGNILGPTVAGSIVSLAQTSLGRFDLYFGTTIDRNQATGGGYSNGNHIASGELSLVPPMVFSNLSGTDTTTLASNVGNTSITGGGSALINVNLGAAQVGPALPGVNFVDSNFIVNNLSTAIIDISASNAMSLSDPAASANAFQTANGNLASTSFNGGLVTPFFGGAGGGNGGGGNNFLCESAFQLCDLQTQMNTTFSFFSPRVPEPGTVALLGAGLALVGGVRARRKQKA